MSKQTEKKPLAMLRHHVSGAIECGEKQAIVEVTAARNVAHEKLAMEVSNRDYVTYRLGGTRCHHKINFVCMECGSEKSYFENLMGHRGNPVCDGLSQKLGNPNK